MSNAGTLRSYVINLFEEKKSLIRHAKLSISGDTGMLSWVFGNAIKAKRFDTPHKLGNQLVRFGIVDKCEAVPGGQCTLWRVSCMTSSFTSKPVQKYLSIHVNWDEIRVSSDVALDMAAKEEMPMRDRIIDRIIDDVIRFSNCLTSIG